MPLDPPPGDPPTAEPGPDGRGEGRIVRPLILPDGEITRRFLRAIGREDEVMLFRALMDDPARKGVARPMTFTGTFEEEESRLRSANGGGNGVFFQANTADGNGWKAGNIVGAASFFADFDGTPLENVDRLGLKPHVTVETSRGKMHYYWRVDGIAIDQWTAIQKRLIALFDSDKSIHDLPRIMRLPGMVHRKNPAAPHLSRIVEIVEAEPYAMADFEAALAAAEKANGIGTGKPDPAGPRKLPASIGPHARELAKAESALRHCVATGGVDLDDRADWIRVGIALKTSFGEDGFALWVKLSAESEKFEGEEDCARQWRTFRDDQPEGKKLTIATYVHKALASGWSGDVAGAGGGEKDGEDDGGKAGSSGKGKPDAASTILDQAEEAGDEHFLDPDGEAYATYTRKRGDGTDHRVTVKLGSNPYRLLIGLRFYEDTAKKTAPREQITAALAVMEARAGQSSVRHRVYRRSAHHGGKVYVCIDVDEGIVAEIDEKGWRRCLNPPVRFVAGSRGALPKPQRGGARALFAKHFNVADDHLDRVIAFMLSTFMERGPYPIGLVEGEAGSAKSNLGDKMIALTDPPRGERFTTRFSLAADERGLHIQAARCAVLFLDNCSSWNAEIADMLCKISTGAVSSHRMLYSDDGEKQFQIMRPLIVTCVSAPTNRTDLLNRSLWITARRIEHRRTEEAVWRDFAADEGEMLGFLFDCVSTALRNREATAARFEESGALPRMADFAQWIEAAGPALGLAQGSFARLMNEEQASIQAEAVQGDPMVEGLVAYFARGGRPLDVTARELLDTLGRVLPLREWPNVKAVKGRLLRIMQGLRDTGIEVEIGKDAHTKSSTFRISASAAFSAGAQGQGAGVAGASPAAVITTDTDIAATRPSTPDRRRDAWMEGEPDEWGDSDGWGGSADDEDDEILPF